MDDLPVWLHGNWCLKSQTVTWSGSDHQHQFNENCSDRTKLAKLKDLGFDSPESVSYSYNRLGFRAPEFDQRPCGIALGCSFTEGVGIPIEYSWPTQLSNMLGTHVWNLGVGGSSLDTAFTLLEYYIDQLPTQFVTVCVPPVNRFEFYIDEVPQRVMLENLIIDNWYVPKFYHAFFKGWFSNDLNPQINQRKNLLAMKQLCADRNIPLYVLNSAVDLILDGRARDLAHPGVDANRDFAEKMHKKITNNQLL